MSISQALLRGRGVYRRLFAHEEIREDEYAGEELFSAPFFEESHREENPRTPAPLPSFGERTETERLDSARTVILPAPANPEPVGADDVLERLVWRMELDSRMHPQDFRDV